MTREEAIGTVRRCCPRISDSECDFETAMRVLIPELAESEDERIIGLIRKLITNARDVQNNSSMWRQYDDALAWLEKQKEQKPVEWSEEDEKPFNDVLSGLKYAYEDLINNKSFDSAKDIKEAFDWMQARVKCFRPSWKPSEEQMICPKCGEKMLLDEGKVYTSIPPMYGYKCPKCGNYEYSTEKLI